MDITTGGPVNPALKEAYEGHKAHSGSRATIPDGAARNSLQAMIADGCMPTALRRKFFTNMIQYHQDCDAMDAWFKADFVSRAGMSELWKKGEYDGPEFDV